MRLEAKRIFLGAVLLSLAILSIPVLAPPVVAFTELSAALDDNRGGALDDYTIQFVTGKDVTSENIENIEIEFPPEFGVWKAEITQIENVADNNIDNIETVVVDNKVICRLLTPENIEANRGIEIVVENVRNPAPGTYDVVVRTVTTGGSHLEENTFSVKIDPWSEWTLMVYLDADCDLEPYGYQNLNAMELPEKPGANVLLLFDPYEENENTLIY